MYNVGHSYPINKNTDVKKEKAESVEYKSSKELVSKVASDCIRNYSSVSQVSFGKRLDDHRSWGANVIKTNDDGSQSVSFKLWAPKADKVFVESRNSKDKVSLTETQFVSEKLKDKWSSFTKISQVDSRLQIIGLLLIL